LSEASSMAQWIRSSMDGSGITTLSIFGVFGERAGFLWDISVTDQDQIVYDGIEL
jgi:hypothetical protein